MKLVDEILEQEEIKEVELEEINIVSEGTATDITSDYEFAREKIITSIIRSSEVLDTAVSEVKLSPSPRSIEAAAAIAKNINEATENLMKLHKEIRLIEPSENNKEEADKGITASLTDVLREIKR
jgi:hypothetical protein